MNETKQYFKDIDDVKNAAKAENLHKNMDFLNKHKIKYTTHNQYHLCLHTFAGDIDFWPSTNKWAFKGDTRTMYGDAYYLFKYINLYCAGNDDGK